MALPPRVPPDSVGLSPARLAGLDAFLQERYVNAGRIPGCLALVSRRGKLAHVSCLGLSDRERGTPMAEDAIFRIYSMTKPITSVALLMLYEEGKVLLEDPVDKYIPSWAGLGVYASGTYPDFKTTPPARKMQVIDLLRHTSGLTYGFQNRTPVDEAYRKAGIPGTNLAGMSLAQFAEELGKLPLEFSPGEAWNYGVSTDVLGYLVEVISGVPFAEFLRTRIFEPLGMVDTSFSVPPEKAHRLVPCYTRGPGDGYTLSDDPASSPFLKEPEFYSGGGGLLSTAADYLRFCHMLVNRGTLDGARILSRKTLRLMASNHLPGAGDLTGMSRSLFSEATNAGIGFGLGFAVCDDPAKAATPSSKGEFYWGGMASTAFWIDPEEEMAVVFMTQLVPSSSYPVRRELRAVVYAAVDD
ncbi:beta-lactamase [Hyaloraphidium curvatum]|nr:beta-lactamase [Hyaloraphidium curvatum]